MADRPITLATVVLVLATSRSLLGAAPSDVRVAIVSDPHKTCRVVADVAAQTLKKSGYQVESIELPEKTGQREEESETESPTGTEPSQQPDAYVAKLTAAVDQLSRLKPTLIISLGDDSTNLVVKRTEKTPILCTVIPNVLDSPFLTKDLRSRLACVAIDISPTRQLEWIAATQPQAKKIGILYSERSKQTAEAIVAAAAKTDLKISAIAASRDAFPKAVDDLSASRCDGVLMIADARVYNLACLKRLLLWGIRQRRIVWAFSESLVKAGAFAAIYVDYDAIGRQTATLAQKMISGTKPADIPLQYPDEPRTAINVRTAELLNSTIPQKTLDSATVKYGTE